MPGAAGGSKRDPEGAVSGEACHPSRWRSAFVNGFAAIESVLRAPVFEVQGSTGLDESFPAVNDLNGAEHTRVRGLMSRAFSHRRVAGLAPAIAAATAGDRAEPGPVSSGALDGVLSYRLPDDPYAVLFANGGVPSAAMISPEDVR